MSSSYTTELETRVREKKILIVEDNEHQRDVILEIFRRFDSSIELVMADTLEETRKLLRSSSPDLVISDLMLPDGLGIDLLRDKVFPDSIPLVIITSHGDQSLAARAIKEGAADYIVRSVDSLRNLPSRSETIIEQWRSKVKYREYEQTLRHSEAKFRAIFDHSPDLIFIIDPQNRLIMQANQTACSVLGWKGDQLEGTPVSDLIPDCCSRDECEAPSLRNSTDALDMALEEKAKVQLCLRHRSRQCVPVELIPAEIPWDDDTALLLTARDISANVEAERVRSNLTAIAESAEDAIIGLGANGHVISWNTGAQKNLGYTHDEMMDSPFEQLVPEDESKAFSACFSRLMEGHLEKGLELNLVDKKGQKTMFTLSMSPVRDINGSIVAASIIAHNIMHRLRNEEQISQLNDDLKLIYEQQVQMNQELEERVEMRTQEMGVANEELKEEIERRKAIEDELSRANKRLSQAVRAKDEFLANMSHELRTPLNAILTLSEGLQELTYGPLNEKQLKSLQTIEGSGQHLLALINDILDLSKIEAGKMELKFCSAEVATLCETSLLFVQEQANKKGVRLFYENRFKKPAIIVDHRRLKQILINLLTNAIKFTPEGEQAGLIVKEASEPNHVQFTIWDHGIGIARENLKRILKPFEQVDQGLTRSYEGTGLGLSLVKRLTDLHAGKLTLDSELGEGTRVTIMLPCDGHPGCNHSGLPGNTSRKPGKTILIVEDNQTNIDSISLYLQARNFRIQIANNGKEALDYIAKEHPDIILMDQQMPLMDGMEATRRIKGNPATAHIPVIAMTALAMQGDRERCLSAGANNYISKPVSLKNLVQIIEMHLPR